VGAGYDRLSPGSVDYGANAAFLASDGFAPKRASFMLDWTPSEFSRVRAQFSRSETQPGLPDNQFFLQYILTLGAHGAHRY
jgi:outer membrane receptor protein involved in Fe transport